MAMQLETGCYIHTHPFNGPLSGTTQVSRYQKGKTNLDFTEARDLSGSGSSWHRQTYDYRLCCYIHYTNSVSIFTWTTLQEALNEYIPLASLTKSDEAEAFHCQLWTRENHSSACQNVLLQFLAVD